MILGKFSATLGAWKDTAIRGKPAGTLKRPEKHGRNGFWAG